MSDNRYQYEVPSEDKWFKWQGQKPPERNVHMTEEEMEAKFATNLKNHACDWKQNGAEIYCEEAGFEHGKRIGVKLRLAGTDEKGEPVLVPVGPILRSEV